MLAIETEGYPTGLVAKKDVSDLLWRHDGRIENVESAIGSVGNPDFAFIGRHTDSMT